MEHSGLHTTVLLHEAIDALVTNPDGIYVDGTFGRGGHTRELLSRYFDIARRLVGTQAGRMWIETPPGRKPLAFAS